MPSAISHLPLAIRRFLCLAIAFVLSQCAPSPVYAATSAVYYDTDSKTVINPAALQLPAGFSVLGYATPEFYGAIADGSSHPVSEWLTGGAHPRGYAGLSAIQGDYPDVTSLSDECDWAATMRALRNAKTVFLPAVAGGYVWNKPVTTQDDGQQIIGGGRQGPYGTSTGARILLGPGIDGPRLVNHACSVRNLTVEGSRVSIHSITSTGGARAVMTTAAPHGLDGASVAITGNTTGTTSYSNASVTSTVTTGAAHGLYSGDLIKISGSTAGVIDGIRMVRVIDSTHFKLLTGDGGELGVASNGGACSFVRVYEVSVGPDYISGPQAAVPAVVGAYRVTVASSTTLELYDRSNADVILTTNATADTGTLYTSRHLIHLSNMEFYDNTQNSPDVGHSFFLSNLFARYGETGFYIGNSDAGGGEHLVGQTLANGLWVDGVLDRLPFHATWMTECSSAGYYITGNGGLVLNGGGGADNKKHVDMSRDSGNSFFGTGNYFEGVMRSGPAPYALITVSAVSKSGSVCTATLSPNSNRYHVGDSITIVGSVGGTNDGTFTVATVPDGTHITYTNASGATQASETATINTGDPYIEVGGDNYAVVIGMGVQDATVPNNCHFHTSYGSTLDVRGCQGGLHAWQQGASKVYGDVASQLVVSYQGATSDDYSVGKYQASDAFVMDWTSALPSPTLALVGKKIRVIPNGSKVTEAGLWICENTSGSPTGTPAWRLVTGAMAGKDTVAESDLSLSDVTTANVSTTKHGFVPKLPNDATKYLDGTGAFSVPAGGGGGVGATYGVSRTSTLNLYASGGGSAYVDGNFHDEPVVQLSSIPTGDYTVRVTIFVGMGPGDTGFKWQLAGSATFTGDSNFTYVGITKSPTVQALTSGIISGDSFVPSVSAVFDMVYEGVIHVTASGSVKLQIGTPTAGDSGQLLAGTKIVLIKH